MTLTLEPRLALLADKKARAARNRRFRALGLPYKACNRCFRVKGHSSFAAREASTDKLSFTCGACDAERKKTPEYRAYVHNYCVVTAERKRVYNREWRQANPEYHRGWRQTNPDKRRAESQRRRALKRGAWTDNHTAADLAAHFEEIGAFTCVYCHAPAEHLDHVAPLARGGAHVLGNLLPACADCNLEKSARDPYEFLAERFPGLAPLFAPYVGTLPLVDPFQ